MGACGSGFSRELLDRIQPNSLDPRLRGDDGVGRSPEGSRVQGESPRLGRPHEIKDPRPNLLVQCLARDCGCADEPSLHSWNYRFMRM